MLHSDQDNTAYTGYVYAERRHELVVTGAVTADEWTVLPGQLHDDLDHCDQLVVVDPLSFPVEDLRGSEWSKPIAVVWPESVPWETAIDLLDGPLLSKLTFFDSLLVNSDDSWHDLTAVYRYSESQRIDSREEPLSYSIARSLRSGFAASRSSDELGARGVSAIDPWTIRAAEAKTYHLAELAALTTAVAKAEASQPAGTRMRVMHIGVGIGRFTSLLSKHEYTGFARGSTMQATLNFPSLQIGKLGDGQRLPVPREQTDLAVATHEMSALPSAARRLLISSIWKSLRVGGKLIVLDAFAPYLNQPVLSTDEFLADLLAATNQQLVVSDAVSAKSHHSPMTNIGVLTFSKIGVPKQW